MRRKDAPTQEPEVEKKVAKVAGEEGPITQATEYTFESNDFLLFRIKMNPHTDIKVSKTHLLGSLLVYL